METVEAMVGCGNWKEGIFQTFTHLREFLRFQRRRPSSIVLRPLSCSLWSSGMSLRAQFGSAFAQFQKDVLKNETGIFPTFLERTAVGCVVELKYGVLFKKQVVFTQKMLMIENAGVVEQVLFVAPHEEWSFYTDLGEKRVDLRTTSQYVVYQKLSVEANLHLMQTINTQEIRWTAQILHQLSSAFRLFQRIFDMTCRRCKEGMKEFLPPLIFDFRNLKNALHETCR
ncbi:unnamed protein product [Angiostrongylus costaricensis]|uniref:Mediator complex subunit 20 n=1 Tax=Angiostrongylus costaricensis TaxID=334426 RepID=A0A0R3PVT1_ANGCS|nr:unnamed protein product [Angiostrongylus costaricensis]